MAIGTIAGISSFCKKKNLEMGVIWIDAHADMNTDDFSVRQYTWYAYGCVSGNRE
jgi:arginase family enzyme